MKAKFLIENTATTEIEKNEIDFAVIELMPLSNKNENHFSDKLSNLTSIINALKEMNIELIELLLDDSASFMDYSKKEFIEFLNRTFTDLKDNSDTLLETHLSSCNDCHLNKRGVTFIGNNSRKYFTLIFAFHNDRNIKVIKQCKRFSNVRNENLVKSEHIILWE